MILIVYLQININVVVYPYICTNVHVYIVIFMYNLPWKISYAMDETIFALSSGRFFLKTKVSCISLYLLGCCNQQF